MSSRLGYGHSPSCARLVPLAAACAVLGVVGCLDSGPARPVPAKSAAPRPGGAPLLETAVDTLWHLDRNVRTNLRPSQVVLDKTSSTDEQTVLGTLQPDPLRPLRGRYNYLVVPGNNSGFVSLLVEPGDQVRLYLEDHELLARNAVHQNPRFQQVVREWLRVLGQKRKEFQEQGETLDDAAWEQIAAEQYQEIVLPIEQEMLERERQEAGERSVEPKEFKVVEVRSEQSLVVEQGLPFAVEQPQRVEIWRTTDHRLKEILADLNRYRLGAVDDQLAWEPSPERDALEAAVDRLNQWSRRYDRELSWQRDPLLDTLPEEFQPWVTDEALRSSTFGRYDGRLLQEAVWLQQISRWVGGAHSDDVTLAARLFDWTVRNIQLETAESQGGLAQRPWETLLFGRGTAWDRAWVFSLLARQQGLDVVVLGIGADEEQAATHPWLAALWSQQQLYLFDPQLGLAVPGPAGKGVATLDQARQDATVLDRLDLDAAHPYAIHASDLREQQLVALIPSSPLHLSRRALQLEAELFGGYRFRLVATPAFLAEQLRAASDPLPVRLWTLPYETPAALTDRSERQRARAALRFQVYCYRPRLWKARSQHFRGDFTGPESAVKFYRLSRPPDRQLEAFAGQYAADYLAAIREAKRHASFWLANLMYDTRAFREAAQMLRRQVLETSPPSEFAVAAQYLLARALEASGELSAAVELLDSTADTPQSVGNALRARWLREGLAVPGSVAADQAAAGALGQ